jgi:hypothetical protein
MPTTAPILSLRQFTRLHLQHLLQPSWRYGSGTCSLPTYAMCATSSLPVIANSNQVNGMAQLNVDANTQPGEPEAWSKHPSQRLSRVA